MSTHFEQANFNKAAQAMLARTSRALPEAVNQALANVAGRTLNALPIADKAKVRSGLLGNANNKLNVPRAALIINARRRKAGKPALEGLAMRKAIRQMVGARARSVGFLRSGSIPGYQKLLSRSGARPFKIAKLSGIAVRGKDKGTASPAQQFSLQPHAEWENDAKGVGEKGQPALSKAMRDESTEIERHIAEKLNPAIKEFNKK